MRVDLSLQVYEHAASLIGKTPWEVSCDVDLLWRAHREAYKLYHHFPVVVGIDIYNLEAEAYGCEIQRPQGTGIPAIVEPLFSSLEEALGITPFDPHKAGRIPLVIEAGQRLQKEFPEADVRIPVSGPFSIAQSILGMNELMINVAYAPGKVREFLNQLVEGQVAFTRAAMEAGLDVIFFESGATPPLLSPGNFRDVELPVLEKAMTRVGEIGGHAVPLIMGGDTVSIIPEMLETGTDFLICPAETDQEVFLAEMEAYPEIEVRVNLDPKLYTEGTKEEILAGVDAVMELIAGRPNVLLGTGPIPYETPPENVLLIEDYVN